MKYLVHVMPRPEALDPQGRAVQSALGRLGFEINECRIGKAIVVDVKTDDKNKGLSEVKQMAEKLLANPLIETYEIEPL